MASVSNGTNLRFEEELWQTADALRGNMYAVDYKHVVLSLIVMWTIPDAFNELIAKLDAESIQGTNREDLDEYLAKNAFWILLKVRSDYLQNNAKCLVIEDAVYNPLSTCTRNLCVGYLMHKELPNIIDSKGREIAEALAVLRK